MLSGVKQKLNRTGDPLPGCQSTKKMEVDRMEFQDGDKVYIKADKTIWNGYVTEVTEVGIWLTEDNVNEEFVAFADLQTYEWAVE